MLDFLGKATASVSLMFNFVVSSAATSYKIVIRLQLIAVLRRVNGKVDFDIISRGRLPMVVNCIVQVILKHTGKQRLQKRSLKNTREYFNATKDFQEHGPIGYVTAKPVTITTKKSKSA
jgi:glucan phosphoethanolaminetransferase (alkaline phosphatase superfamily)